MLERVEAGEEAAANRPCRVDEIEQASAEPDPVGAAHPEASQDGKRPAHERRRRQQDGGREHDSGNHEERRRELEAVQEHVRHAEPREQRGHDQRVEADPDLEHRIGDERIPDAVAPAPEPIAPEREAAHVGREHRRHGVRADPEDQRELARPEDFVEEADGAGKKEDGDDERLHERGGVVGRHGVFAPSWRAALARRRKRSIGGARGIAYARAHA